MAAPAPASRSLSAWLYLRRNPRRVLPLALIQALVTALLVAGLTPMNTFDRMAEAYVRPLEAFTIVTPQFRNSFDDALLAQLDANPHQARRLPAKMLWFETPAILGRLVSPLVALRPQDQPDFLRRLGVRLAEGVLPKPGTAGAAISRALLRARGLSLGDTFGRIVDPDDTTPGRFDVVGVLEGEARLGVVDLAYASIRDYVLARTPSFQVIYAKPGEKTASDDTLKAVMPADGGPRGTFRVVDERWARARIADNLKNLPLIVGFITLADAIVVALVTALLGVIAFQGRQDEFALLLAVGHRRGRLVRKLALETTITAVGGWIVGWGLGIGVVALYDHFFLEPKAIEMSIVDPRPLLYSLSVPVLSAAAGSMALARRLRRMDPVAVIQRRGV